jgi:hypothetical protein
MAKAKRTKWEVVKVWGELVFPYMDSLGSSVRQGHRLIGTQKQGDS